MIKKRLKIFAFAIIELIDSGICEDGEIVISKLNSGELIEYLREKYAGRMPLLIVSDLSSVNKAILNACGGDTSFYLSKYPKTNNGLTILMNLIINAL